MNHLEKKWKKVDDGKGCVKSGTSLSRAGVIDMYLRSLDPSLVPMDLQIMSISEKQDEKVIGKQRIMGEAETEEHLLAYAEKDQSIIQYIGSPAIFQNYQRTQYKPGKTHHGCVLLCKENGFAD